MIGSIDDATAELYGGPLDEFVARRDALAKEVRAGGDRILAAEIKALRKPTVAADALNRAIRQDPEALDRLLGAVETLRATQEAMLAGESVDFGADQAAYRGTVEAVAAAAVSHRVELQAALEAAAIGGLVEELRAAAFATLPEPSGGFGPFAVGPGSPPSGRDRRRSPRSSGGADKKPKAADTPGASRRPSAAERRMAERARRAAEQAVTAAEAANGRASRTAEAAADRVAVIDQELADLSGRLDAARQARDDAVVVRAEAEAALAATTDALDDARAALDELDR